MRAPLRRSRRMALGALGAWLWLGHCAFADVTTDLVKSLQLIVAPAPVKQRPDWRVPHKVMLLEFGPQDWAAGVDQDQAGLAYGAGFVGAPGGFPHRPPPGR